MTEAAAIGILKRPLGNMEDTVTSGARMRSVQITAPGRCEIVEGPLPRPGRGQVRVKLEGCGVCASNLPPWEGKPWFRYPMAPGALGHEGWGRIDAVGEGVSRFRAGERVAFLSGHAYAEYDLASEDALLALPPELEGKPFPGEPLGCAVNIFKRSRIGAGTTVAIVGIGFLGALLTKMATAAGARVLAVARRASARSTAERMGAAEAIPMEDQAAVIEAVRRSTGGKFCDVVVEAAGKQWPLDLAAELCRERGSLIIAGYHQDGPRQVNMQLWNWRGLDVVNAHEREERLYMEGMEEAARAVARGDLDPFPLYTHKFPLEDLGRALDMTRDRPEGFMKALIIF
jgi:threonine dehydrogenase-like Zn-dependent dehydrogenase